MNSDIEEINFTDSPPQHSVKVNYPADPVQLANILDWLWNSGYLTFNMPDDMIEKGRARGIDITIVEDEND